jgi:hypothetical protein
MADQKIVFVEPVFRAGGMRLPAKTVTPFVAVYVSPEAVAKAAEVGAKAFVRAIEKHPAMGSHNADDVAFWAADRAITRYAKDPKMSVKIRGQFRVVDRHASIIEGSPPCGQNEYFDAIPKGYSSAYLPGRDWLWPALLRLNWVVPATARATMLERIKWELDIAKDRYYPKETRADSKASAETIKKLLAA